MAMTQGDISDALNNMSKEDLLRNCVAQIQQYQEQAAKLKDDVAERDRTIDQLKSQSQVSQDVSNRLIKSAQDEAQRIIDDANQSKASIQRQSEDIVNNARQQSQQIIGDAHSQADKILADAKEQASSLITTQLQQAQGELDKVRNTKQQTIESTMSLLQGIMGECDKLSPALSQGANDVNALRRILQDSISSVQNERFTYQQQPQPQTRSQSYQPADMKSLMASIVEQENAQKPQPRMPVTTRGGTAQPQPSQPSQPQSQQTQPTQSDDDEITIPQPQRKQPMPETFVPDDDDDGYDDDFTFNPDTADSFTSEFMGIDDDQLKDDKDDEKPKPEQKPSQKGRKSKGGWY